MPSRTSPTHFFAWNVACSPMDSMGNRRAFNLSLTAPLALLLATPTLFAQPAAAPAAAPAPATAAAPPATEARRSNMWRDPFYLQVESGVSYVALMRVRDDRTAFPNFVSFTGWGPGVGMTAGLHALIFSVGVQFYATFFEGQGQVLGAGTSLGATAGGSFHMLATTVEGALRIPSDRVEFSLRVALGHAFMGGFYNDSTVALPSVSANGWIVRTGLGLDFRIWRKLFIGIDADVAVANVRRAGISGRDCPSGNPLCVEIQGDGDAIALMVQPHLQVGWHF
jgi:hypothetical protein